MIIQPKTDITRRYRTARCVREQLELTIATSDCDVEDLCPRIAFVPSVLDESPDEAASTAYFLERMRGGSGVVIDLPAAIDGSA